MKIKSIVAIFTFVAAAIGLIVAAVYFIDRKCGLFCDECGDDDMEYCGEEYYADDLTFEPEVVENTAEEETAEQE